MNCDGWLNESYLSHMNVKQKDQNINLIVHLGVLFRRDSKQSQLNRNYIAVPTYFVEKKTVVNLNRLIGQFVYWKFHQNSQ